MGIALGDYLHTGRISVLISHFDDEYAAFYRNDGGMNFTDVAVPSGLGRGTRGFVGWGDVVVVDECHPAAHRLDNEFLLGLE